MTIAVDRDVKNQTKPKDIIFEPRHVISINMAF